MHRRIGGGIEFADDLGRGFRRGSERMPGVGDAAVDSDFVECGNIRQRRDALLDGHGENSRPPRFVQLERGCKLVEHQVDIAGEQIVHRRCSAFIGHVRHGVDTVTRIVTDKMRAALGQPLVVENKPGVSGSLAAETVSEADPDGYTLLASQPAPITTAPLLYKSLNYDPAQLVPVAIMSHIPNVVLVRKDFPAKTVRELIAYAKANPGKINYASQGIGTTSHTTAELFQSITGTKLDKHLAAGSARGLFVCAGISVATRATLAAIVMFPQILIGAIIALTSHDLYPCSPSAFVGQNGLIA